jgi:hypothetical protein
MMNTMIRNGDLLTQEQTRIVSIISNSENNNSEKDENENILYLNPVWNTEVNGGTWFKG